MFPVPIDLYFLQKAVRSVGVSGPTSLNVSHPLAPPRMKSSELLDLIDLIQ
jgi:hypothetical protein